MIRATLIALALASVPIAHAGPPDDSVYALKMSLTDQTGQPASLAAFRGHPVLITMFYGSCPRACPLLISKMKLLEQHLSPADRDDLRVLLVTLDPQRDTPEVLAGLAAAHGVDLSRWKFLRTGDAAVRELAAVLGVKYHRLAGGAIWHTSVIVSLDREGRIVGRTEGLDLDLKPLEDSLARAERR